MILVTGSSGFIGHAVTTSFGKDVVGLRRSADGEPNEYRCNLTDIEDVKRVADDLKGYSFTHLIHTAAVTPWSNDPNFQLDSVMAESVIWLCEYLSIPNLFFISGWNVYDATAAPPFSEDTPIDPIGEYGASKYAVEQLLATISNIAVLNLRLASVYGSGQMSEGLIPNLVTAALSGQEINIDVTTVKRDYLYIDDLVDAIRTLVGQAMPDESYLNIGSGKSVSIVDVAESIQSICRRLYAIDVPIRRNESAVAPTLADNQLAITRATSLGILLNTTSLNDGLEAYIKWRKNETIL